MQEIGKSVYRADFRKLLLANGHGGQPQAQEITARELILLSGRADGAESSFSPAGKVGAGAAAAAPKGKESFEDFPEALDAEDDDLPF